jgi:rhodanese-related sulfurtransferase
MDSWGVWIAIAVGVSLFLWWRGGSGATSDPEGPAQHNTRIYRAHAHKLVKEEGATLLDVRTPGEFAAGHVQGARNIPLQQLAARVEELGSQQKPVVVYCRSGNRSRSAMRVLVSQGFSAVYDLGPMSAW